jgi:hypothetical protein
MDERKEKRETRKVKPINARSSVNGKFKPINE